VSISNEFLIAETDGWSVSHRGGSALPGYLMVGCKTDTTELFELPKPHLSESGPLLARAEKALLRELFARRVYIGRYGRSPGYPIHFHVIPIYQWVEILSWESDRYRLLEAFAASSANLSTDGAQLTLFVWREFCERANPPAIVGPDVGAVIERLRNAF
jgi:diadenosine tetraphosphate (Ap4A) HIT family hydrolase